MVGFVITVYLDCKWCVCVCMFVVDLENRGRTVFLDKKKVL